MTTDGISETQSSDASLEHYYISPNFSNPIDAVFPQAVATSQDFYDRYAELNQIRNVLLSQRSRLPIVIQGERCIGKTSLINRVKRLLEEEPQGSQYIHFSIEPDSFSSWQEFAQELWYGLSYAIKGVEAEISGELDGPVEFHSFTQFVTQLKALQAQIPDKAFVIFLDEFDKATVQMDPSEKKRIMGQVRQIVEQTELALTFVISVLQNLPAVDYGSPLPERSVILRAFTRAETDKLANGLLSEHIRLDREGLDWLYEYTGGHPYFVKWLLAALLDRQDWQDQAEPLSAATLQAATKAASHRRKVEASDVLEDIYANRLSDEERCLLVWLASQGYDPLTSEKTQVAWWTEAWVKRTLDQLQRRGYITQDDYRLRMGLMWDWLRSLPDFETEVERLQSIESASDPMGYPTDQATDLPSEIVADGLCIDLATERIYVDGREIEEHVGPLEYRMLLYLAERVGQVVFEDELGNHIYPDEHYEGDDQRLTASVYRLRQALPEEHRGRFLKTVRKRGYRLEDATLIRTTPK